MTKNTNTRFLSLIIAIFLIPVFSTAQVLSWSPLYPQITDSVTVIFDASQGNAALTGVSPVYMHTGVLTTESVYQGDWKHKPAIWGEADSVVLMEPIGNNKHRVKIMPREFYGVFSSETVTHLCFVFSNADGTIVGKNADESDIFIKIYNPGDWVHFSKPVDFPLDPLSGENIPLQVIATETSFINLYHDGNLVAQSYDTVLNFNLPAGQTGKHKIWFKAQKTGETVYDTIYYIVKDQQVYADPPAGTVDGINYINDSTVVLRLFAPNKNFVYLIGDFNDWEADPDFMMKKSLDNNTYWLEVSGLEHQQEYGFQYFVDFMINIADPYAELVLDRWDDLAINAIIYPNLKPYPIGKTSELVSVIQTGQEDFDWQVPNFQKPDNRDLVIYEMLVRDWHLWHNYKTVKDSIEYLKSLGVNAIEFMPVNEYDGNDSWGYMPASFMALDKWYGTREMLKEFVDIAHQNGIAVIIDIVLNHASGQNTLARLYKNIETGKTTAENPWFNERIPHPYGYHHDFDHASPHTQYFIDRVIDYWVSEYHIDGFRFDLSKGFTNNVTVTYDANGDIIGTDVGAWGQYDAARVGYLERMAGVAWGNHPGTYLILEHLANFDEEKVLSDFGFMLWCGMSANQQYKQAAIGYSDNSDFKWGVSYQHYQGNDLGQHNLVGYMESHDEERLMYECSEYGNEYTPAGDSVPSYSIKDKNTALERMELVAAFFFTVPGPKMIWQFGERGYDYSINWPSMTSETRTAKKPPKWDYMKNWNRYKLYKTYAALIELKTTYPLFRTSNYEMHTSAYDKRIRLWDDGYVGADFSAVVVGNFNVEETAVYPEFSTATTWYDYFSGDSLVIEQSQTAGNGYNITYQPGEWHIFTDKKLPLPDMTIPIDTSSEGISEYVDNYSLHASVYPNPTVGIVNIDFDSPYGEKIKVMVYSATGEPVRELFPQISAGNRSTLVWDGNNQSGRRVSPGNYFFVINAGKQFDFGWITVVK